MSTIVPVMLIFTPYLWVHVLSYRSNFFVICWEKITVSPCPLSARSLTRFILWLFNDNGIATSYGLDGSGLESWNGKESYLFSKTVQTGPGAHPASCSMGVAIRPRPACEVNHSPPSSAEGKNEWSYTHTSPPYLDGVATKNDLFYLTS